MRRNDEVEAQRSRWTFYEAIKVIWAALCGAGSRSPSPTGMPRQISKNLYHIGSLKRGLSLGPCGFRARGPDRNAWNHKALTSSWMGRGKYPPPPLEGTSLDLHGQGATQPMLPARSVPAPGPPPRRSRHFINRQRGGRHLSIYRRRECIIPTTKHSAKWRTRGT